jgi:hypothetical protein
MTNHVYRMRLVAVPMLLLTVLGGCAEKENRQQVASAGGGPAASASAPADQAAQGREFAKCMRAAGVEMPDPGPDGMVGMPAMRADDKAGTTKMEAAMEKCREFLPTGGEPPKASAEDLAKARDYAKCIREHGLPDFPDPDPETGRFSLQGKESDGMKNLAKASENCQQFGAGVMPGIQISK